MDLINSINLLSNFFFIETDFIILYVFFLMIILLAIPYLLFADLHICNNSDNLII